MKKLNENEFKCEICMEDFDSLNRKPNSLVPCGHTFCIVCLEHIGNNTCPTCRSEFNNFIPNWEIIKRLNDVNTAHQHIVGPASSAGAPPLTTQPTSADKLRTCCSTLSSHFYALSMKRKCKINFKIQV